MYVTEQFICFSANVIGFESKVSTADEMALELFKLVQVKIEIAKIKKLEKCKVMQWFDTGIEMVTEGPESKSYTFSGF